MAAGQPHRDLQLDTLVTVHTAASASIPSLKGNMGITVYALKFVGMLREGSGNLFL